MGAGDLALKIIITATGAQAIGAFGGVNNAIKAMTGGISAASLAATMALVKLAMSSVSAAANFQQQMLHIQALAGMTADQYQHMSDVILAMAPQVGQAPVTLAKGLFQVVSAMIPYNEWTQTLYESGILATSGMADETQIAKILSQIMNIYGISASTAANDVTDAVTFGQMTMTQYANSIGLVIQKGKAAGFSFNELNAALDTLTTHGFPSAQQASRNLGQLFIQMDINMDSLAKRADGMGLSFNESAFKTMNLSQQIGYLNKITGGNVQELHKLIGGGVYAFQTFETLSGAMGYYSDALGKLGKAQNGVGAAQAAWTTTQQGWNVKMQQLNSGFQTMLILIGNQLIPKLEVLISPVLTLVTQFTAWIASGKSVSSFLSLSGQHAQVLLPILAALGTVLVVLVVPALWAMAMALLANPFTWLILGVVAAVAAFVHFYQTNKGFKAFIDMIGNALKQLGGWIQTTVLPALKQFGDWLMKNVVPPVMNVVNEINANFVPTLKKLAAFFTANILPVLIQVGGFLMSVFTPIWKQLVQLWNNQLLPLFKQLWSALQATMPLWEFMAKIIGGILVVAFLFIVGVIDGFIRAIQTIISDLASFIAGVVQFVTGIVQVIGGIASLFSDIFHGKWSNVGNDLKMILTGILNIFGGFFQMVGSLVHAIFAGIMSYIAGFFEGFLGALSVFGKAADGIRTIFQAIFTAVGGFFNAIGTGINNFVNWIVSPFVWLYNELVGHSIVPDMINGIVSWFKNLPSWALNAIANLLSGIISFFTNLGIKALNGAKALTSSVVTQLGTWWNGISSAIAAIPTNLENFFGGLATQAITWGANIISQLASGIISNISKDVGNAMSSLGNFISSHLPHSPAKMGPLRELAYQGEQITTQIATGIIKGAPSLQRTLGGVLKTGFQLPALAQNNAFALQSINNQNQTMNMTIQLDSKQLVQALGVKLAKEIRIQGNVKH